MAQAAPGLVALPGVGTHHAATLLVLAGDNPQRLRNEASFASLCGVSPVEASSGKVVRHRLNRGGNRDANRALHMICVVRMGSERAPAPTSRDAPPKEEQVGDHEVSQTVHRTRGLPRPALFGHRGAIADRYHQPRREADVA